MLKIMPMGDSNTLGAGNPAGVLDFAQIVGYRRKLKEILAASGVDVDFVGAQLGGQAVFSDPEHEGWPGDGIEKIKARISAGVLEQYKPDIVLLLVGANDMWVSVANDRTPITVQKAQYWVGEMKSLLMAMCGRRPATPIIVGKPCTPSNAPTPLATFREGLEAAVQALRLAGLPVSLIDTNGLGNDGVHFSVAGHEGLAQRWAGAVKAVLAVPLPTPQPPVPAVVTGTPTLTGASVTPQSGDTNTTFNFSVVYRHPGNVAPTAPYLVVAKPDGQRLWFAVTPHGTNYATGVTYAAAINLPANTYPAFQFEFHIGSTIIWGNPATPRISVATAQEPPPQGVSWGVSASRRYLVAPSGVPQFYLADTAWTIASVLPLAQMQAYLDHRLAQGFNAVQAIGAHWGYGAPQTWQGQLPFLNNNPATPNPAYWSQIDNLVSQAAARGMTVMLVPAWYEFVTGTARAINMTNARAFGVWLGTRYGGAGNLMWALGGDCNPTGFESVYAELAAGIRQGGAMQLMTFHPNGNGTSSTYFGATSWLQLDMLQTQHGIEIPHWQNVAAAYARTPVRPVILGEACYEDIIPWPLTQGRRIDDLQVRKSAYQALLSGACGYCYGCNGVFQFYTSGEEYWKPRAPWTAAMDHPGAQSMKFLRRLTDDIDWWTLVPANIVVEGDGVGGQKVCAAKSASGSLVVAYVPEYGEIALSLAGISGVLEAMWYDPRTGEYMEAGTAQGGTVFRAFAPLSLADPDYVLVLQR